MCSLEHICHLMGTKLPCVPRLPWQLGRTLWLSSDQQNVGRDDICPSPSWPVSSSVIPYSGPAEDLTAPGDSKRLRGEACHWQHRRQLPVKKWIYIVLSHWALGVCLSEHIMLFTRTNKYACLYTRLGAPWEQELCSVHFTFLEPRTVTDTGELLIHVGWPSCPPSVTDFYLACYFTVFDTPVLVLECGRKACDLIPSSKSS